LPTATPVDVSKLIPGTLLDYVLQPGDTLKAIALRYNSTQKAIQDQNKLTDVNKLIAGQKIVIPVNIATPVPTTTDTPTPKACHRDSYQSGGVRHCRGNPDSDSAGYPTRAKLLPPRRHKPIFFTAVFWWGFSGRF